MGKLKMGKLKWVIESISFSCKDTLTSPHQMRQLSVSFPSAFRVTRFRLPVSLPPEMSLIFARGAKHTGAALAGLSGRGGGMQLDASICGRM